MFEPEGNAIGLKCRQSHRAVAGVLVDLFLAGSAFLFQRLQLRKHGRHQLNDDGGRDVGHDAEREDRHALHRAAGKDVEHVQHTALLLIQNAGQRARIDAGHRDEGAQTDHDHRAQREQDALTQLGRLGEGTKIEIRR